MVGGRGTQVGSLLEKIWRGFPLVTLLRGCGRRSAAVDAASEIATTVFRRYACVVRDWWGVIVGLPDHQFAFYHPRANTRLALRVSCCEEHDKKRGGIIVARQTLCTRPENDMKSRQGPASVRDEITTTLINCNPHRMFYQRCLAEETCASTQRTLPNVSPSAPLPKMPVFGVVDSPTFGKLEIDVLPCSDDDSSPFVRLERKYD